MSLSVTLADANILVSRTLRDYFVYAAKSGALQIHWSPMILEETSRNLVAKFGHTVEDADVLVDRLSLYPQALVETRKRDETTVADVAMDDRDRHVLAAALSAKADVLLTDNTPDFPKEWMAKRGVELIDAGTLLTRLAADYPDILREPTAWASPHAHRPPSKSLRSLRGTPARTSHLSCGPSSRPSQALSATRLTERPQPSPA